MDQRSTGPEVHPFVKIGRGLLHTAIFTIVNHACALTVTNQQITKDISEGLNTIRLHVHDTESTGHHAINDVGKLVYTYCKKCDIPNNFCEKSGMAREAMMDRFRKRHPELSLRKRV